MAARKRVVPKNYKVYRLTPVQTIASMAVVGAFAAVGVFIFYQNLYFALAGLLFGLLGPRIYRAQLIEKRAAALNIQFKDFLYALNSAISAGKSLEDAIIAARKDMEMLYMDDNAVIMIELDNMAAKLSANALGEELIDDLARRSGNEDIQSFANVLSNGRAKGVNMTELIQKTVMVLSEKLEVKQEIATNLAAMKSEQTVMMIMPVALILMLQFMAPDYLAPLYESPIGYVVVTVAVALLAVAVFLSRKILNIKV